MPSIVYTIPATSLQQVEIEVSLAKISKAFQTNKKSMDYFFAKLHFSSQKTLNCNITHLFD